VLPYGPDAVLVECADLAEVMELSAATRTRYGDRLAEVVPAARTVLIKGAPVQGGLVQGGLVQGGLPGDVVAWLADAALDHAFTHRDPAAGSRTVELEVVYDGADLDEVARLTGMGVDEVVTAHRSRTWTVAFCGFVPGFAYLVGPDDALQVPRRASPRPRVPAGAVALADRFCGVYPRESPGGWQLIGRTDAALWRPDADRPALLAPGDRVRFRPAGR